MVRFHSKWLSGVVLGVLVTLLCLSSSHAATINVPADQPTIQAGIDVAVNGDTVLVAPGTYTENINYSAKSISIISSGGALSTTLIAAISSTEIVTIVESEVATFRGFTVNGGFSTNSMIRVSGNASASIIENIFHGWPGGGTAGVLVSQQGHITATRNLFHNNPGGNSSIGAIGADASLNLVNNTFDSNRRGFFFVDFASGFATNNIITNSTNYGIWDGNGTVTLSYNDFWNNNPNYANEATPGIGDISVDPNYTDPIGNDYTLQSNSPCIDAGDPDSSFNDSDGSRSDMGAFADICFGLPGPDSDFDGRPDSCDGCPNDSLNDADGDGICGDIDNCPNFNPGQEDTDGDSFPDACDNCPLDFNTAQLDSDSDGIGDVCDTCPNDPDNDLDGDGICGDVDNCPNDPNSSQTDSDGDGNGDPCDICPGFDDFVDSDSDGNPDGCDICPGFDDTVDTDGDSVPDGCDLCEGFDDNSDGDSDGVPDGCDICLGFDDSLDSDSDSVPDGCDICAGSDDATDTDGDTHPDGCDNCPDLFNQSQLDLDNDSVGNGCDNCPTVYNPDQLDSNNDGVGDACLQTAVGPDGEESLPRTFQLYQNFPNPFNPTTKISLDLPQVSEWSIVIYNLSGQIVREFHGRSSAGTITVGWDASEVSSGVYLYKAVAGKFTATRKMLLLK